MVLILENLQGRPVVRLWNFQSSHLTYPLVHHYIWLVLFGGSSNNSTAFRILLRGFAVVSRIHRKKRPRKYNLYFVSPIRISYHYDETFRLLLFFFDYSSLYFFFYYCS